MKYQVISLALFIVFVGESAAQHSYPIYGQTRYSAELPFHEGYSPTDTAYLNIRGDSKGQQFLTLDNYTDTTITYLSGRDQFNYTIEALNPALNQWQPLGDYDPSQIYCGVGVYNYEVAPTTYTWTRLRRNRYPGKLTTQIRYVLNANGQKFSSPIQSASIDPKYFGTAEVNSGGSYFYTVANSIDPNTYLAIVKSNFSVLLHNGFGRYSLVELKRVLEEMEAPSGKNFTLASYMYNLLGVLGQANLEDVEVSQLLAGVQLFYNQVDGLDERYQKIAANYIETSASIVSSDPIIQAIIANYEDRLDFFFPEVVGPIIEKYFEY